MDQAHHHLTTPHARCACNLTTTKRLRRQIPGCCFFQYDHVVGSRGVDSSMSANAAFAGGAAVTANRDRQAWQAGGRTGAPNVIVMVGEHVQVQHRSTDGQAEQMGEKIDAAVLPAVVQTVVRGKQATQ